MIKYTLDSTLHELGLTKNKIGVLSSVRPSTIANFVNGQVERIEVETLNRIIDALNINAIDRGLERRFTLADILVYEFVPSNEETQKNLQ